MDLAQQFQMLGRKQLAIQEGIELLQQMQIELARVKASADAWGVVAVMANVTLIPLNIIINAFELKSANTAYQMLVRYLYNKYGKSGTRIDGHAKTALSVLKREIVDALKRKALTDYVPGVNILVGLAEDSLAAWQAIALVEAGSKEISMRATELDRKIAAANRELVQIGIRRAAMLGRLDLRARTA